MRVPPYTTRTGLQIGIRYEPPRSYVHEDMVPLQSVLLDKPAATWHQKMVDYIKAMRK